MFNSLSYFIIGYPKETREFLDSKSYESFTLFTKEGGITPSFVRNSFAYFYIVSLNVYIISFERLCGRTMHNCSIHNVKL